MFSSLGKGDWVPIPLPPLLQAFLVPAALLHQTCSQEPWSTQRALSLRVQRQAGLQRDGAGGGLPRFAVSLGLISVALISCPKQVAGPLLPTLSRLMGTVSFLPCFEFSKTWNLQLCVEHWLTSPQYPHEQLSGVYLKKRKHLGTCRC